MQAKDLLVGPSGLRSGWRLLIFLAITIAVQAGLQGVVLTILRARGIVAPDGLIAIVYLIRDAMAFLAISVAAWIRDHKQHRKLNEYGPQRQNRYGWESRECASVGYDDAYLLT